MSGNILYSGSANSDPSLHPDNVAAIVEANHDGVLHAVTESIIFGQESGATDIGNWSVVYKRVQQQTVVIVDYEMPGSVKIPLVFKPTNGNFARQYQENAYIRKYFPRIYTNTTVPAYGGLREILVIEKIEGLHGDSDDSQERSDYYNLVDSETGFDLLCQDMFSAYDELLASGPISLTDVGPARGHNVFFNHRTGHFQIFDVDTIWLNVKLHIEKFVESVQPRQPVVPRERDIYFIMRMLQMYQAKYQSLDESYVDSEVHVFPSYELIEAGSQIDIADEIVTSGNGEYRDALLHVFGWPAFADILALNKEDLPSLRKTLKQYRQTLSVHPDVLAAMKADDANMMKAAIRSTNGNFLRCVYEEIEA